MRRVSARTGSALLIVLGMMAFMVVSAVAFSAYMRTARLPSSYLRRVVASRMLVKAALANAIDEIDAAIGDFPHPGVWMDGSSLSASENVNMNISRETDYLMRGRNANAWLGRVYIGGTSQVTRVQDRLLEQNETVPTLTLEGLAYIPPPLVNEARYYSRHSNAGTWHSMGFDAGRYAFCAIDVSDYFDINALMANTPRNSSPSGRISLSYLFENEDHGSAGTGGATWDEFIGQCLSTKVPLISLADWNLAMGSQQFSPIQSYFYRFVQGDGNSFYNGDAEGNGADRISRMAFVTDGWFPETPLATTSNGGTTKQFDLSNDENQPFLKSDLESDNRSYYSIINYSSQSEQQNQLMKSIPGLGFCALFDYLDKNDTPLSLAIPTLERTPMICGISPGMSGGTLQVKGSQVSMTPTWVGSPAAGGPCHVVYQVKYEISGLPNAPVETLVTFPFRNKIPNENSYEIGGRMSLFLSLDDNPVGMRTRNNNDVLHLAYKNMFTSLNSYQLIDNAVMAVPLRGSCPQPSSFDNANGGEANAIKQVALTPNGKFPQTVTFLEATYEWDTTDATAPGAPVPPTPVPTRTKPDVAQGDKVTAATCSWIPLDATGTPSADFAANLAANLGAAGFTKNLKLNLAVWVWIKNTATGKVVDLVPACVYDDGDLNNLNTDNLSLKWGQNNLGVAYPLMRFDMAQGGSPLITFKSLDAQSDAVAASAGSVQIQVDPATVYVGDPRYNHAPESWFGETGSISPSDWLQKCGCRGINGDRRDGDIFMQTSDQCYLQSIYELANLPRLYDDFFIEGSTKTDRGSYANPSANGDTKFRTGGVAASENVAHMWRTYDPFVLPNGNVPGDDFDNCGFSSSGNGFKVNPYTDSTNVMMAAFANTPLEWRFASIDEQYNAAVVNLDAGGFNRQYAWNAYSSSANIDWEDLNDVAGRFMDSMRNAKGDKWEDVYADLGWYDDATTSGQKQNGTASQYLFFDQQLGDTSNKGRIYNCDKKFLYGYWHDCFALKQQLFLVFVRAEPMLMGGGAVGQTPPQLGGRAVALVWRDPIKRSSQTTTKGAAPHRTRVLFYRQFD